MCASSSLAGKAARVSARQSASRRNGKGYDWLLAVPFNLGPKPMSHLAHLSNSRRYICPSQCPQITYFGLLSMEDDSLGGEKRAVLPADSLSWTDAPRPRESQARYTGAQNVPITLNETGTRKEKLRKGPLGNRRRGHWAILNRTGMGRLRDSAAHSAGARRAACAHN